MKTKLLFTIVSILVLRTLIISNAEGVTMSLDKESYIVGETVTVTFEGATGNANAWFAIYPSGEQVYEDYPETDKVWVYANSNSETPGSAASTEGTVTISTEGLTPGKYRCTYFPNGGYTVGNTVTFDIVEESTTNPNPETFDSFSFIAIAFICSIGVILIKPKTIKL